MQPKCCYPSISVAELRAGRATKRSGKLIIAYACPDCGGMFHISNFAMLGTGLAVGGYWHLSRGMILTIALLAGLFAVLHELVCYFVWCSLTGWWIGRKVAGLPAKR